MKWLFEWFGQSFAYLIPIILIIIGGICFVTLMPNYGFYFTVAWAVLICVLYIRYSKWL